jgi:PII-like signaling protein
MKKQKHSILKIYASTTDRIGPTLLYEHIVNLARDKGLSGVTVYRGIMGYGLSCRISMARFWELTEKLPIMIEIIDNNDVINEFYNLIEPDLLRMQKGCLVIIEPITIKLQKSGSHVVHPGSRKEM